MTPPSLSPTQPALRTSLPLLAALLLASCGETGDAGVLRAEQSWWVDDLVASPCGRPDQPNVGGAPWGLAFGPDGELYLSELFAGRFRVFSPSGQATASYGSCGMGDGQFDWPKYLDVHPDGWVFVADVRNYRIQKWSLDGEFVLAWGQLGSLPGEGGPAGLAVDPVRDEVYTLDAENHRVQVFDLDGLFLRAWGEEGTGEGQFDFFDLSQGAEGGVAIGADGSVYVVDHANHRVQVFTPEGAFLRAFDGDGTTTLYHPSGIAVTSDGHVFVADEEQLWAFSTLGTFLGRWVMGGERGGSARCSGVQGGIDVAEAPDGSLAVTQGRCVNFYRPEIPAGGP
ncbi:MAG: NHL repeat-containing protein [Myxococcales bacterium]|nr:NHL repeat-containing protein [Myxococcales bacterium]MCB9628012.1 NHL repeat-containing protein [Sandaracinaceae bacterium]